ncbi:DUF3617 domain-containing protein [Ramlibacter sp. PS4R-6]|uniref:DUF3617 domain-containing protein n=1 Tax=Ramlibacter sp. PS4R-6 TaxID=3133438 RepID=UPI0030B1900A
MTKRLLAAAALLAAAPFAFAQSMKPGLWEISNKMQSSSGQMEQGMAQMQQQMANMPPEQRKMVEDMMKQRGMSMGGGSGGGMTVKFCMSKEMAERREIPSQRGDCKTTRQQMTGNTMKMAFTCTNPPSSGEGEVTFQGPEAYQMKMVVHTQVQGKPETVNMQGSGRWLGADCGDIKPMAAPQK